MPSDPPNLSPYTAVAGVVPFPEAGQQALLEAFAKGYVRARLNYDRQLEQFNAPDRPVWVSEPHLPEPVDADTLQALFDYVSGASRKFTPMRRELRLYAWNMEPLGDWFAPPEVHLVQVVRIAHALGHLDLHANGARGAALWWKKSHDLDAYYRRSRGAFGLRELSAAAQTLPGVSPAALGEAWLKLNSGFHVFCDWDAEAIWPYFDEHLELLVSCFSGEMGPAINSHQGHQLLATAFRVLGMFPTLPEGVVPLMWEYALGEQKTMRAPAQQVLARVADKLPRVMASLHEGRQAIRAAAADWLGELGDPSAIPSLREAFLNEKQEVVKGTLIQALDRLGADVNEFLDRAALLQEARKGLKKKRPKGSEWLLLETLPELFWSDTGQRVEPEIVGWWVLQSVVRKNIAPGPLVQRYLQLCRPGDVARLARFLLASWIEEDTRTPPVSEVAEQAGREARALWTQPWAREQYASEQELYKSLFNEHSSHCVGSAIGQKGVLSLVAIGGDRECVRLIEQYLRKWFGQRLAQCKALLEVLAWIDDPVAIQALIAVSTRFRTKSLQKVAAGHVQSLAERRGWTLDELADRTLPDGGFTRQANDNGTPALTAARMVLDYGPRSFIVTLTDDLRLRIANSDGKALKNLPAAGKQDDPELVKMAKKSLSEARKTVRELTKRQTERFYEALCTQRTWSVADWLRDLRMHPIVGPLCTRLVWMAVRVTKDDEKAGESMEVVRVFRPLEDGSLTDHEDQPVELTPELKIGLAHTCSLPQELEQAWIEHLADYDVQPLFPQFNREAWSLTPEMLHATDVMTFQGHMLTTFRLRSKANRLNWTRGAVQDAGSFWWYAKPFPSLRLEARLEFTGSFVPEEDIPAALRSFYFVPLGEDAQPVAWDAAKLPLSRVPRVLLSEIFADVKSIAAEGTGFDPNWEQRGLW